MTNLKYQNYLHFKLPITTKPLEYGKLIEQISNKYIVQLNSSNVAVINQIENNNFVKLFRKGDLMFEYKDSIINERRFIRIIQDKKYTYENYRLISIEIMSTASNIIEAVLNNFTPFIIILLGLYFIKNNSQLLFISNLSVIPFSNIIKLRRRQTIHN
jgi:hypothetical protein